jgi:hypothetical protein
MDFFSEPDGGFSFTRVRNAGKKTVELKLIDIQKAR